MDHGHGGDRMSDTNLPDDDHYQPWLRNSDTGGMGGKAAGKATGKALGSKRPAVVTRPTDLPTTAGRATPGSSAVPGNTARNQAASADELFARPLAIPHSANDPQRRGSKNVARARDALSRVTHAASELVDKADLPSRVEQLEVKRRLRAIGDAGAKAVASGGKAGGKVARVAVDAAKRASDAAGPRIRSAATAARDGMANGATTARAAMASRVSAAQALLNNPSGGRTDAPTIASALDQLLAQESTEAEPPFAPAPQTATPSAVAPATTAADLPLFHGANHSDGGAAGARAAVDDTAAAPAVTQRVAVSAAIPPAHVPDSGDGGGGEPRWLRHPASLALGAALLAALGFIAGTAWTGSGGAISSAAVRAAILADPQIVPDALTRLRANQAALAINRVRGQIERPFSGAWAGAADGDVTLVVFTDYACTFCKASGRDIDRLLRDDPRLKIVFREMPILSADSEAAARIALAAAQRGRYMPMHRALFAANSPDLAARGAAAQRLDTPADAATLNSPAITRELQNNIALARDLGFSGTPGWVVGDRAIDGAVGYDQLRAAVAAARAG